jgi:hypothetical protein
VIELIYFDDDDDDDDVYNEFRLIALLLIRFFTLALKIGFHSSFN